MKYKKHKSYWQRDIRKREYLRILMEGTTLVFVLSYVFYGTLWAVPFLFPLLIGYFYIQTLELIKKKQSQFRLQFKNAIQSLSAALHVGYSAENAMRETYRELQLLYQKEERILREFRYMNHQLDMNMALEGILSAFAKRTMDEEVRLFVTVFSMAKRSGGDMIAIIRSAIMRMTEKVEMEQDMQTTIAAKKLEFQIMTVIPIGILLYMKVGFPEFLDVLYGNVTGVLLMSVCLIVYIVTYVLGRQIVEIEV